MKALVERYAAALVDVALEQETAEQLKSELGTFADLLNGSADLANFLASPAIPRESKQAVIEKLVKRMGAGKTLRNFLFLVVDHGRAALLPQMRDAYEKLLLDRMGIAEVQVTSAAELGAEQKKELLRVLERLTGRKIEAKYAQDEELIGGAKVRIGSTIYDGSVRRQLDRMRAALISG